jgi:hypothetical protein
MTNAHTVYVDDSGTDSKSRIITAAFCVSTVEKWLHFERRWKSISVNAGFKHFHMTEFAACKREKPCNQCARGETTLALISQQKNKKAVVSWHNSYSE